MARTNLYAVDGRCHNAEGGTFGHECGRPAIWIGTDRSGFAMGFCADCKAHGMEARQVVEWRPRLVEQTKQGPQLVIPGAERSALQAMQSREDAGHGRIRAGKPQQDPSGLFAPREPDQPGFDWEG